MANLLETYKSRLAVADQVHAKTHNGQRLDSTKKLFIAKCLDNTNKFLTEAFENSTGTQRSDMGAFKKFTLNLTNVVLPNLIAPDLVLVHPMASFSGYVTYLSYVAGSTKGDVTRGDRFNSIWEMGQMTEGRQLYTSDRVVETFTGDGSTTTYTPVWTPVDGTITAVDANGDAVPFTVTTVYHKDLAEEHGATTIDGERVDGAGNTVMNLYNSSAASNKTVITFGSAPAQDAVIRIGYVYNNVVVPQNDLPLLNAKMESIALTAHARRIAISYSQMAAFQAKQDYGFDLGDKLAEQASAELSYEIDSEVVNLLADSAEMNSSLTWSKTLPVGVGKMEHYAGFSEMLEIAKAVLYKRTQKFSPNYMLVAADVMPVLTMIPGWSAAPAGAIAGPYFAGTLNGLRVYVSPIMADGTYVLGVNGNDMMTSAAVYAPYMPIVPTQLLGFADGNMTQGFSTLYDLKLLSTYVKDGKTFSPLLIKGQITA